MKSSQLPSRSLNTSAWMASSHMEGGTLDRFWRMSSRYDIAFFVASLGLLSFSLPGREGPESAGGLDLLALTKLGIRVVGCVYFAFAFVMMRRGENSIACSKRYRVSPTIVPWIVFAAWSLLSVAWSALPVVSIGQWLGLVALLMFAQTIAWRYRDSLRSPLPTQHDAGHFTWVELVVWVHAMLFVYCGGVFIFHLISPELSGLDRALWISGNNGLVHPTAAGATSSLGVVIGSFLYVKKLTNHLAVLAMMILVELAVLYFSKSRSALLMTVVCFSFYGLFLTSKQVRGVAFLALGTAMLAMITIDPGLEIASVGVGGVGEYVARGQTANQLQNASGRSEMWAAIWQQFQASPLVGHGYFVTSSNGKLDVWQGPANRDAHNIILQVLVTTGLIGMVPFAWGLWRLAWSVVSETDRDWFWLIVLIGVWYLGWSQGCVTFLGPVRPESVVFFAVFGIAAGRADWRREHAMYDSIETKVES